MKRVDKKIGGIVQQKIYHEVEKTETEKFDFVYSIRRKTRESIFLVICFSLQQVIQNIKICRQ